MEMSPQSGFVKYSDTVTVLVELKLIFDAVARTRA
jgi:hypothetical protein